MRRQLFTVLAGIGVMFAGTAASAQNHAARHGAMMGGQDTSAMAGMQVIECRRGIGCDGIGVHLEEEAVAQDHLIALVHPVDLVDDHLQPLASNRLSFGRWR